jgi:hypothetical protein
MMSIGALSGLHAAWKAHEDAKKARNKQALVRAPGRVKRKKKNGKKKKRPAGATRPILVPDRPSPSVLIPYEQNHHPLKN